jgi:hypothetical protein
MIDLEAQVRAGRSRPFGGLARRISKSLNKSRELGAGVLIVTSRHKMWQKYGPSGLESIERAVGELADGMAARGLEPVFAYADDSPLLSQFGVLPADTRSADSVSRTVRDLAARMAWTEQSMRYVLLLGDDGVIPFHRPDNPSPEDGDTVLSDQPYAADPGDPMRPMRAVGRIPDPTLEALVASLHDAAQAHERLAKGESFLLEPRAFGYSASVWKRAARGVYETLGQPSSLRLSPPLSHREIPEPGSTGPRFRYFNLHGLADSPHWFGQRDPSFPADYPLFPVALRPVDLDPAPGALVFSEACYGAHIQGRSVSDSVALTYLSGGALGFAGATGVAYGGLDGPLVAADLLAQRFWQAILAGAPAGQALSFAKLALVKESLARQGYLDSEDEKAILNFVLLGDPSLVHHTPTVWEQDTALGSEATDPVELAGSTAWVGTLSGRPHTKSVAGGPDGPLAEVESVGAAGAAENIVQSVHNAVAKRLPEFAFGDVRVSTTAAPRRAYAKAIADPASSPMIITFSKSAATCSGAPCTETVRVTVDRTGTIRKVVVAR